MTLGNKEIRMHFHRWAQTSKTDCSMVVDRSANPDVRKKERRRERGRKEGRERGKKREKEEGGQKKEW